MKRVYKRHPIPEYPQLVAKRCLGCTVLKDAESFYSHRSKAQDGRHPYCKPCHIARANKRRIATDPEALKRWTRNKGIKRYGIQPTDYHRLVSEQGGVCAICRKKQKKDLCIDHDHSTGRVRGLLCNNCNWALGHLQEDPVIVEALITYIRERCVDN